MISWREEFALGIPQLDEQHKKLFDIAGRIYELLKDEYAIDKYDGIVELIEELKDYTIYHFKTEEEYMESIGYKKFFTHKMEHEKFVDRITNVDLNQVDENHDAYLLETLDFVVKWIEKHILEKDKMIVAG
ncbi:MAG: hemerythrin family protein [Clostridia bacterium]|nr:hemerythrin family protein [Clostridia bacterium]